MQDTSSRWAQVNDCDTYEELQQRLEEEAIVQRTMFPVSRLKNKTRLQAFPQLEKSTRQFTEPGLCAQLVYEFLAKKIFTRKVSSNAQISHFGQQFTVPTHLKGILVQVKLNIHSLEWEIYHDYKIAKRCMAMPQLSLERIQYLSVYQ